MANPLPRFPTLLVASALFSATGAADNPPLVLDAETRAALTPESVLQSLLEGNRRYVDGELTFYEAIPKQVEATASGQFPKAIILSCVDSRVPVEMVFDQGIGDVFVARVAGNVDNVDILGSMEFATAAAGSKLVMVLGHESCGAVKGACQHMQMGNLTALLEKLQPAVRDVAADFPESRRTAANPEFVDAVVRANVRRTVADIRRNSPILAQLEDKGDIAIVGAYYSLRDGSVSVVD